MRGAANRAQIERDSRQELDWRPATMLMKEPAQPEYFLESFHRDTFPASVWTERQASLPHEVWTTETTHRDGQQGGLPLTIEQGLAIYDLHCRFTGASR